jgi:hypothetical protein
MEERMAALEKAIADLSKTAEPYTAISRQERMANVLKEWNVQKEAEDNVKLKAMDEAREKAFDAKLAAYAKAADVQDEEVLRRFMGVDKDEPLKKSDLPHLISALRKAALETTEPGTRSPASAAAEKAGPDGNTSENPFAKQLKEYGVIV